ncbi:MAG TPA: SNF2-related protein [Candidatus Ozemobacteraceae bacterium]|nr:SNF2-related protein [Candidatus Ozemobacteraceae bacterium]
MSSADCLLPNTDWHPSYSHEDGDLIATFYEPALRCGTLYRRVTGYFSGGVLNVVANGLLGLLRNGGKMELVSGCTLTAEDVARIEQGLKIQEVLSDRILREVPDLVGSPEEQRERLGWLAWMVAHGHLQIKVAVPRLAKGNPLAGVGLVHAKVGLITDRESNTLAFSGSLNETEAGWKHNWESFSVSCSWRGEWDRKRISKAEADFHALWTNTAKSAEVFDIPTAVREKLLSFIPDRDPLLIGKPVAKRENRPCQPDAAALPAEIAPARLAQLWSFIKTLPRRQNDGQTVAIATSTVTPWPHQVRAYQRLLKSWPIRLLIADEVGLGKTIEAGLAIRHLLISGKVRRLLILAPKAVLRQWQGELYEKFNLIVPIYTGQYLVYPRYHGAEGPSETSVESDVWNREPCLLVSSQLARRRERQKELEEAQPWDMVVLDEAHHARRRGAGTTQEGGANLLLRLMRALRQKTESLLLLTATPMQVAPVEVWDLLDLLGMPEEWSDETFVRFFEDVQRPVDDPGLQRMARLFQVCEARFGPLPESEIDRVAGHLSLTTIDRKKILDALREPGSLIPIKRLSPKQRMGALALLKIGSPVRALMSRHTRTLLREYYRRGLLTQNVPRRLVEDLAIEMNPAEQQLYQAVEEYISSTYQAASLKQKPSVGFIMTIYRRRMASSFHALKKTLMNSLERLPRDDAFPAVAGTGCIEDDDLTDDLGEESVATDAPEEVLNEAALVEKRESILELLRAIAKLGTDSKALRLSKEIRRLMDGGFDAAIVFTQYTDTMDYLKEFLSDQLEIPIGCFCGAGGQYRDSSGVWTACSKEMIKRYLNTRQVRVMICTDAAGEGLNLQTCGALINYDLPWNPMKVEQRIGRIDRIGQKYADVRVVNLAYADTIEADIYFALSRRIDLFNGVVGRLQPILAQLPGDFERAVLCGAVDRSSMRKDFIDDILNRVELADRGGFDIDAISDADVRPPGLPVPPVSPADMDRILSTKSLLPKGVTCRPLEPMTYSLQLPGAEAVTRVTSSPEIFDEHFESHQLIWHGSPLFERLVRLGTQADQNGNTEHDDQYCTTAESLKAFLDMIETA